MRLTLQKTLLVVVINLVIAIGFFIENLDAGFSELSSDLLNIIPVAQKFDNPELYKHDLFVDDINNVKYYTPFFVQPLRFIAKFTNYDYLQALNVMSLICHFLFGVLWFLMFYKYSKHFLLALLVSLLVRGIVWLPGFEIWGISGLWSMMPRTLYIALFPIPFLILSKPFKNVLLAAFLIGLIFNCHPITGLGGILLFILYVLLYSYFYDRTHFSVLKFIQVLGVIILGMLPFVFTYFGKTSAEVNYSLLDFNAAFNDRIPNIFTQPSAFLKRWFSNYTILLILPTLILLLVAKNNYILFKKAKLIVVLTLLLFTLPLLSVYIERFINSVFNLNLRLSFQLIRLQKVAIVPSYFALLLLLVYGAKKIKHTWFSPVLVSVFVLILITSKTTLMRSIPLLGNDIFSQVLPFNLSFSKPSKAGNPTKDKMAKYIEENTPIDAIIYGDFMYRSASKRSVMFDNKGASMLIEGNPVKLIDWYKKKQHIKSLSTKEERWLYLKSLGVDYYVTYNPNYNLEIVHKEDDLILYKF
ncbi:hypothetical protein [Lacinutrix salivirga]